MPIPVDGRFDREFRESDDFVKARWKRMIFLC